MRKVLTGTFVAAAILWISTAAFADSFTFSTLPASGLVTGPANSTVGWGYKITNQSLVNWLVTTNLSADLFLQGAPSSLFDFPILPPNSSITLAFNVVSGLGLYELTWNPTATAGFNNNGTFIVSAEWWSGDPFAAGNFIQIATDQRATYSATVTTTPVPEPSSLLLLGAGYGLIALKETLGRQKNIV